jgi:bifunctional non-homologous end joining protein LigD
VTDFLPFPVKPMLATLVPEPFHRAGWIFEEKYDGYRILACKRGREVTLQSRNGVDKTSHFSEIAEAVAALPARTVVLDGEVVGFDERLVSRFQLIGSGRPLVYAVFDCLYRDGRDLRGLPLAERRAELEALIGNTDRLLPSRRIAHNGLGAYRTARKHGYEGIVAKDLSSPYVSGRSMSWLKVKVRREEEFVVAGYTQPAGARAGFGALLLGAYDGRDLRFVGKVGSGFTGTELGRLSRLLARQKRVRPAFASPPRQSGATWIKPKYVAQIEFQEWTNDGKLRQPVYLGLRDDKEPSECRFPRDSRAR